MLTNKPRVEVIKFAVVYLKMRARPAKISIFKLLICKENNVDNPIWLNLIYNF